MKKNKSQGFTLIELIVSIALIMIILFGISGMIRPMYTLYFKNLEINNTTTLANRIFDQLDLELRNISELQLYPLIYNESDYPSLPSDGNHNYIYVNKKGYLMIKRSGENSELLFNENFYDNYHISLQSAINKNLSTLEIKVIIYTNQSDNSLENDGLNNMIAEYESSIELVNVNSELIEVLASDNQIICYL